jgi:hypothetical protein
MGETIADVSRRVVERGDVRAEADGNGLVTLRRRRYGALRARIVAMAGVPADFTVHLDPLGSAAWNLIDGRRTVADIKAELARTHPDEPDLGARLGKFLGAMVSHEMVRLA